MIYLSENSLTEEEKITGKMMELYSKFGYRRYRMGRFEEYDFYAKNRKFLISDNIITFNDGRGRLLALKPDVTLSIIRNTEKKSGIEKLCYKENVYRASIEQSVFNEILQTGVECIGDIDGYTMSEVLFLACESLAVIPGRGILSVSDTDIAEEFLIKRKVSGYNRKRIFEAMEKKCPHELRGALNEGGLKGKECERFMKLSQIHGSPEEAEKILKELELFDGTGESLMRKLNMLEFFGTKTEVRVDFSIVGDLNYYNGTVFRGYKEGVSAPVLTGGNYGRLMRSLEKGEGACGFAVYFDRLEEILKIPDDRVEYRILYDDESDFEKLAEIVNLFLMTGTTFRTGPVLPDKPDYRSLVKIEGNEVSFNA